MCNKKLIYWETITENRKIYERYKYYGISLLVLNFYYMFIIAKYSELSRGMLPKKKNKYLCNVHK